ncbi:pteridine reductase [Frateuria aurantia]
MPNPPAPPVALVTGASQRIGAAIVRCLHQAGYCIALHYRQSVAPARALQAELEARRPGSSLLLQADLADTAALPTLVNTATDGFGRLDLLVNNASAFYPTPVGQATETHWDDLFAANAKAPFFLAQAAAPWLRASRGSIVNLTDIYAERSLADHPIYVMAKAALAAMTRSLAVDLAPEVRVNAVAPGAILWPQQAPTTAQQAILERTPLGRTGQPEDIAAAVLWLAQGAPYVSGQILAIDGARSVMS